MEGREDLSSVVTTGNQREVTDDIDGFARLLVYCFDIHQLPDGFEGRCVDLHKTEGDFASRCAVGKERQQETGCPIREGVEVCHIGLSFDGGKECSELLFVAAGFDDVGHFLRF